MNEKIKERIQELQSSNIQTLVDAIHTNARLKGFHPEDQSEGDYLAHMCCNKHGEVTELYEAWRAGELRSPCDKADAMEALGLPRLSCLEEELADLVIRCFDESRRFGFDISRAIAAKHLYNTTRPHKHGKQS